MNTPEFNANVAALAQAFAKTLQRDLTPAQWFEMRKRNRANTVRNGGEAFCASHDFIDSNMTMAEAFKAVTGRAPGVGGDTPESDADIDLWNAAWSRAYHQFLSAPKVGPPSREAGQMMQDPIFHATLDAMQAADEIGGVADVSEYIALMQAIATACLERIETAKENFCASAEALTWEELTEEERASFGHLDSFVRQYETSYLRTASGPRAIAGTATDN